MFGPLRALVSALAAAGLAAACAGTPRPAPVLVSDGRYVMGTVLELTLVAPDAAQGREALRELFALAERLDALLTLYAPESGLSQLNAAAGRGAQRVDPELAAVLARALEHSQLTAGSFDVTVRPLVELWTRAAERDAVPSEAELAAALTRVGYRKVRVESDDRVALEGAGTAVDLGGIAKGWALDRMLPVLERFGIEDALLNFGQSSVWALGRPPDAEAWRLVARGPDDTLLGVLNLVDRALSVSGSLGQWLEIGDQRFGHVIDPRSGRALQQRRQAMVLAPDATLAEALSKALLVLGEREGLALIAAQPGCEALLVDADGGVWPTPGWNVASHFESF